MGKTSELFIEIRQQIQESANKVLNGEINPFELGRELSYTKNAIQSAKEKITDEEKLEFEKYSKEELKDMNIQLSGGGYTWKFDHIPEWIEAKNKLKDIEDKAKAAFNLAAKANIESYNKNTGEEIIPAKGIHKKQSVSYR